MTTNDQPAISELDRDTSGSSILLWLWMIANAISVGILFGNAFATETYFGGTEFNGGAFVGGALVGALSTFPVWAIYRVLRAILFNLFWLRRELASARQGG